MGHLKLNGKYLLFHANSRLSMPVQKKMTYHNDEYTSMWPAQVCNTVPQVNLRIESILASPLTIHIISTRYQ